MYLPIRVAPLLLVLAAGSLHADLVFPEPARNVGEVRAGVPLAQRFPFINRGSSPVDILDLRTTCGCVKPSLTRRTFAPGEKGDLLLEVHTLSQPAGQHTWHLWVKYATNGATREVDLQLQGRIVAEVMVRPVAMTLVTTGDLQHEMTLTDTRARPFTVKSVQTTSPNLNAVASERSDDPTAPRSWTIALKVASDCPEGRHEEIVHILTDDPTYGDLTVPVTVVKRARDAVSLAPRAVSLFIPRDRAAASQIVLARPAGDEAVTVERIETGHPDLRCTWAQGPGALATIKVQVSRTASTMAGIRSEVRIHLSKPLATTLTLPVTCRCE